MREEAVLIEKAKNDINERNNLILKNIKLIYKIASYFDVNQREDLINEGVFGLIEAVKKYNVQYKCKFSTYQLAKLTGSSTFNPTCSIFIDIVPLLWSFNKLVNTGQLVFS